MAEQKFELLSDMDELVDFQEKQCNNFPEKIEKKVYITSKNEQKKIEVVEENVDYLNLKKYKKPMLINICKKLGIKKYSKLKKQEVLDLIEKNIKNKTLNPINTEMVEEKSSQNIDNSYKNTKKSFCKGYKNLLFDKIKSNCCKKIKDISHIKTTNGNTQSSERLSIELIENILIDMNLNFTKAGTQQSKDFRNVYKNVKSLGINIEIKKTNNNIIYFNDTLPSVDIYYIIFVTGKVYKNKNKNIPQQIIFINGYDLIKDDFENLMEYKQDIEYLKNKWARKKCNNKANSFNHFSVYPRPTFKTDIKYLLNSQQSFVLGEVEQHSLSE